MSNARRQRRSAPASAGSRPLRDSGLRGHRCDADALAAQSAALETFDAWLGRASCAADVYKLALRTVRSAHPCASTVLLEVDAEHLASSRGDVMLAGSSSRRLADRVAAGPLSIDADDLVAVNQGRRHGPDPLEKILEDRLDLRAPAIGRVRLDGAVVALLVLDRSPRPPAADSCAFVDRVAERASTRMDSIMDAFWADLVGCPPPT